VTRRKKKRDKKRGGSAPPASSRSSGGSLQNMLSGFRTMTGAQPASKKPSKLGSIITWLLLAGAIALLVYRFTR